MAAVCNLDHFKERLEARPENRDQLMKMNRDQFIAVMVHWRDYFIRGADLPVIGATKEELQSIKAPACIVPGNDKTHPQHVGEGLGRLLSNCEVHPLMPKQYDLDMSPREEWDEKEGELAAIFGDFLKRISTN